MLIFIGLMTKLIDMICKDVVDYKMSSFEKNFVVQQIFASVVIVLVHIMYVN
jgi:hypothetical protein